MPGKDSKPGQGLERRVADAYRAMGARKAEHDVELAGNQTDVYVEMESADHALHRIAVEVKDWRRPVGIDVINKFALVVKNLRNARLVDEGVIVSASGFSRQARNAAQTYGIRLLDIADLEMGIEGDRASQPDIEHPEPTEDQVSGVRFVNREYELRRICTLNGAQFALVDAPAGYGKSYLLREVRRQLCGLSGGPPQKPGEGGSGTCCALVEFSDRLALERQVLDAICQQLDIPPASVASVDDLAPELIAMTERSEDHGQKLTTVMLMFDNIDQIPMESVKTWLVRDLIAGLDKGLDATESGPKLRAVLAGRFVASEWDARGKRHSLKFMLLPLSPFSRDIVEEAVRLKVQEVRRTLDPSACRAMARGIVRLTGGHPRCMGQLIDHLAKRKFSINYEGPGNYFDRIRDRVFRDSVRPVIDALMDKLDDRMSDLLSRICVFRRFDQRILDVLLNSGEIEGFESGEQALVGLNATALITSPGFVEAEKRYEHLHTDRIARRLLALAMRTASPRSHDRLNAIARHIFKAWLAGKNIEAVPRESPPVYAGKLPNKPRDHLQVALVQEYLYHYLQSVETVSEEDLEQEARRLHDELDSSLGAYDVPNQGSRLRDALMSDWELEDRIYYLAGGEEAGEALWERLLGWVCGPPL
jgi:hypothetical protein